MPIIANFNFDEESEVLIRGIWDKLEESGVPVSLKINNVRPHISLGVCEQINREAFQGALEMFAAMTPCLELDLSHVGVFPNEEAVLFLGLTDSFDLLDLHEQFHTMWEPHVMNQDELYLPGNWVPHSTLTMNVTEGQLGQAMSLFQRLAFPIPIRLQTVSLVDRSAPNEPLVTFELLG